MSRVDKKQLFLTYEIELNDDQVPVSIRQPGSKAKKMADGTKRKNMMNKMLIMEK